jgi:hypothetical protein
MAEKTVEIPPLRLSLGVGRVAPLPPYQAVARQYITSETEGRWSMALRSVHLTRVAALLVLG